MVHGPSIFANIRLPSVCCAERDKPKLVNDVSSQLGRKEDTEKVHSRSSTLRATSTLALDPKRPIRFLCLHGSGANTNVMKLQIRYIKRHLGAAATFDFLQGGIDWDVEHVDAALIQLFGQGPYYGWWSVHRPDGSSVNRP